MNTVERFNFINKRKIALVFSLTLLALSIGSFVTKGLNLGLDFTGGTLIEVEFEEAVSPDALRATLASLGFRDAVVQQYGSDKDILIRVAPQDNIDSNRIGDRVFAAIKQKHSSDVELRRVEFVGPKVGEELSEQGGLALLVALVGILVYVSLRFEYRFALGSVAALVHDVLITVGLFSLLQIEFDLTVLAALLAVIGYSLNDTIVVFDRIRENFLRLRKKTSEQVVNISLNQTLSRTLVTSLTTLLVLAALYFFGGELIAPFALALIFGVLIGTYSSIYVASTTVLALGISKQDLMPPQKEGEDQEAILP